MSATGGAGDARQFSIYVDVPIVRNLADGVDQVRQAVRTNFKHGADFVKILATGAVMSKGIPPGAQQYSDAELAVAVEEADALGPLRGRARARRRRHQGGAAGRRPHHRSRQHAGRGRRAAAEGEGRLLRADALRRPHDPERQPGAEHPGAPGRARAGDAGTQERAFKLALAHELPIAFATDAGVFPHGENAREFKLRVGLGQTPMAAIEGATRIAAEAMGWADRVGTLQPGRFADLIAVASDPLADISELERVQFVMKGGTVYKSK